MTQAAVKQLIRSDGFKCTPLFKQAWAMSAVFLSVLSVGLLQHPLTAEELYSASSPLAYNNMATIFGYFASSILMDQLGRQLTFILGTLPGIFGCCMLYYPCTRANSWRITLNGLSTGFTVILGTVIIGEYTSPKYRGVFLNLITTSMNIGSTIGLIMRPNYQWQLILAALFFKLVSFGLALTWPESPYWLNSKKKYKESERACQILRRTTCKKEITDLKALRRNKSQKGSFEMTVNLFKKYTSSAFLRPLTIVVFGVILMESSAKHILPVFSIKTVKTIGIDYQMVILLSSIATFGLVLILRHRTQLLITGCLAASTTFLISFYVFLTSNNFISGNISWLGSLLFNLQVVFSNLGCTSIPLALIGEVFPMDYKSIGCLVSGVLISVSSSAGLRSIAYLLPVLHLEGLLILFGALMTVSLLVLCFILPETKHKTLLEIEEYFNNECREGEIGDGEVRYKSLYNPSFLSSIC